MLLQRQQQKIKSEEELKKAWEVQKKQEKEKQALETGPGYGRCNCPAGDALTKPLKESELIEKHILYKLTVHWTVKTA